MRSHSKFTISFIFLLSLFIFSSCKENTIEPEEFGSISGLVIDAVTNQPVISASVTTAPATNAVVTDANGKFTFNNILIGQYTINVSKTEYQKSSVVINVSAGSTSQATVQLEKKSSTNSAPDQPFNPIPADGAVDQSTTITFAWSASDPDKNDSLKFDLYLYRSNNNFGEVIASDISDTSFTYSGLNYNTTYYWQVVAKDTSGEFTNGKIWSFTTAGLPQLPLVFSSDKDGNYEIYLTDSSATEIVRLTERSSRDWNPIFSPDGSKIAFTSDQTNEYQIYIMNRDGSDIKKITSIPVVSNYNNGTGFDWSPDGSYLIYCNYDKLYRIESDGTNLTQIATAPAGRQFKDVSWSSLNRIATLTVGSNPFDNEIYLMDVNGSNMSLFIPNLKGTLSAPVFSTDGNKLMFTFDVSGNENVSGRMLDSDIIIMSLDKTDSVNVSGSKINGTNDLNPRFTSNGARIVFENQTNDASKQKEVWLMDINGNNRRKIMENGQMPDWH